MNIIEKIRLLINSSNEVTKQQASNLTEAMQYLKDGYGGGGEKHSGYYPHNMSHNLNMTKYEYEEVK